MTYAVTLGAQPQRFLDTLPRNLLTRMDTAIDTRLAVAPTMYGKPLRGSLAGYWKLRVGDYRIIYRITGRSVFVVSIRHRKDAYGAGVAGIVRGSADQ